MFKVPSKNRILTGLHASSHRDGNNGAFLIDKGRTKYFIIASDGMGYEHVSVHCESLGQERTPTWAEMCMVKDIFWDEEDCVVQYHPAKSQYVNQHKHTLHLWRPIYDKLPIPDKIMVGFNS